MLRYKYSAMKYRFNNFRWNYFYLQFVYDSLKYSIAGMFLHLTHYYFDDLLIFTMRQRNVWKQQPDSLSFSPPPAKHIPFIHRNSTWLKLPSVETYHSHPWLLDSSHWAVRPMPSVWVGREPPGRPGLMSPWASKPRGPIALGNVANQGCTLAMVPLLPLA